MLNSMSKALGMVEYKTVSSGMFAADMMLKTAAIEIIEAQTVCPGKYIVILCGELSAVNSSIEAVRKNHGEQLIDSFILGNPHDSIFPAIYGTSMIEQINALGILETFSAPSIIVAADEAAKTAHVELIELRIARGMCGKSYLLMTGEIAAVEAAILKAEAALKDSSMFLDSSIIANPDGNLCRCIL